MPGQGFAQTVIDSLEFARTGQTLRGSLPLLGLARLKDSLADALGTVEFEVRGGEDARRLARQSGLVHRGCPDLERKPKPRQQTAAVGR